MLYESQSSLGEPATEPQFCLLVMILNYVILHKQETVNATAFNSVPQSACDNPKMAASLTLLYF